MHASQPAQLTHLITSASEASAVMSSPACRSSGTKAHVVAAGVSISAGQRSDVQINPESEEGLGLREWYDTHGCTAATQHAGEGLANARSAYCCYSA